MSGTRCLRRDLFLQLATTSSRFGIETELVRRLAQSKVPCVSAPVRFTPRTAPQGKKIRLWHLAELVSQALK